MLEKNIYIRIIFTLNTCDMKQLTVVFALLCIFACSSEDIVSTVEESVKPANEVAIQTVNLLDSLEIMDYIYSIIGPMAKTRSNLPGGGYILPDNWDSQLTDEQRELIIPAAGLPAGREGKRRLALHRRGPGGLLPKPCRAARHPGPAAQHRL